MTPCEIKLNVLHILSILLVVGYNMYTYNNKVFSFVSRCCLLGCISRLHTACLLQAMRSTGYAPPYRARCSAVIGWFSTAADQAKPDGVAYRIPCEWGKVYIGETGRPMQDIIKEHDRNIRFARTQTSAVSEHSHNTGHYPLWNEVIY